jgi:cytochrome c biogenesis protein CcdA
MGLGLLYVPCAGPVLTVISVVGASHQFSVGALVLTGAFAVGVGLPLLAMALAESRWVDGWRSCAATPRGYAPPAVS